MQGNEAESASNIGQLVYGFLHLLGAANACTNPILYGLLNENFLIQYKRLYRWLPGYYGDRARRYSIPSFQRNALHPHLERQNAFRVHRLSIYPSHNTGTSKETTEEHLVETKPNVPLNTVFSDGLKDNSQNREIKGHNNDNVDLVVDSPSQLYETTFQQQTKVRSDETKSTIPYCLTKFSTNLRIPEHKILQSKTQMKDWFRQSIQKKTRKATETRNAFVADDDSKVHSTSMSVVLNKRKQLGKSSLSLDDIYIDDIELEMSKNVQVDGYKHEKNRNPENDEVVSNNPCHNCPRQPSVANDDVNRYMFAVSHNPKSPVYSLLIAKNKIKYIETIKKMDDVDSAYEDDYYSPCPTTTDSLAAYKTFDFDNIGGNEVNNHILGSKSLKSNYEKSDEKLTTNVHPNGENYIKNIIEKSNIEARRNSNKEQIDKSIDSCEAFNHELSNKKSGFKGKSKLEKTNSLNIDNGTTISAEILEVPKPNMVLKRAEPCLFNDVIIQNETYV